LRELNNKLNKKTMNKDETILEIMKDYPTQKIGLDDFYGRQTVINMMNKAINYTHSRTELKDKKEMNFVEYLISKGYKLSNNYVWQIDNRDLSNDDIIEQRKQYEY
tara:strand:- start:24 stop:341 length:318 start_codon:yes stop_codon:yes gene_type:complete